jgi:hypothetical protein
MEKSIDRLNKIAELAKSAPLSDREQIERIIRMTHEAADTSQQTAEIVRRMVKGPGSQP